MSGKPVQGFYDALRRTFFASRLIGVFPITGLLNSNSDLTRCSWLSPYTLYYAITTASITWCALVHLSDAITSNRQYKEYGGLVLYLIVSVALMYMLRLALNWRNMVRKINELEKLLPPLKNINLVIKNINRLMIFITIIALTDYVVNCLFTSRVAFLCYKKINEELTAERYFNVFYGWYIDIITLNYFTAIWLLIVKLQVMLVSYFMDALVVAVVLYLIYRFRNFNRLMNLKMNKCNQNTRWSDIQAHYTRLTRLVKIIDDAINPFVFLSFLSSLVFMCKMIYDFIQRQKNFTANSKNANCNIANSTDFLAIIHGGVAVICSVSRALSVSMLSSHLHSLSREPLDALHSLPASAYNLEFQRFMDQVYYSKICISGLQFFYVTRGTILTMLSTIITYELVLLQLPVLY